MEVLSKSYLGETPSTRAYKRARLALIKREIEKIRQILRENSLG